jgi:hypothetical protein
MNVAELGNNVGSAPRRPNAGGRVEGPVYQCELDALAGAGRHNGAPACGLNTGESELLVGVTWRRHMRYDHSQIEW